MFVLKISLKFKITGHPEFLLAKYGNTIQSKLPLLGNFLCLLQLVLFFFFCPSKLNAKIPLPGEGIVGVPPHCKVIINIALLITHRPNSKLSKARTMADSFWSLQHLTGHVAWRRDSK